MEHPYLKKPLNTDQAAKYIGRSPGALRNLVMRRKIPFRKVAGRLVFFQDELNQWWDKWPGVRLEDITQ